MQHRPFCAEFAVCGKIAVFVVADNRQTDRSEMNAQLMGASGDNIRPHHRSGGKCFQKSRSRQGGASVFCDHSADTVCGAF